MLQHTIRSTDLRTLVWIGVLVALLLPSSVARAQAGENAETTSRVADTVGLGRTIRMGRATWDTGWFQAEIFKQLFQELGYRVEGPRTYDNEAFYRAAAQGDVDLWVNGWFPLHGSHLQEETVQENVAVLGYEVRGGALQGYLVDAQSAAQFDITSLADFQRTEVVEAFDADGDGRAELIGCNAGWGCERIIEHHLDAYGLRETIEHVQGDYGPLMLNAVEQWTRGTPLFFYTWTPNWTIGALVPGQDVVWIEVPRPSLPADQSHMEESTIVPDIAGCVSNPCALGFPPSDIRTVANRSFLAANPAVRALLKAVTIPLEDIAAQNARLIEGEDARADITRHAAEWIAANRSQVDVWLSAAARAQRESGVRSAEGETPIEREENGSVSTAYDEPLRVATKPFAPFVMYDVQRRAYTGFSIELWEQIATEVGFNYELYGVNSVAKLLDEVERGAADAATAGIGITSQRENYLNFSHPYFESGLQIMIATRERGLFGSSFGALFRGFFSWRLVEILGFLLFVLLLVSHVIWLAERHSNPEFSLAYWPGIWEAFWWSAVTATTVGYGDKTPKTMMGRLVGLVWMFAGLFVLAYFTAGIAASFALSEVEGHINGPDDLSGKEVATIRRSPAADYLAQQGITTQLFEDEQDAYTALIDGRVDAVVYDAPVLQHYVANEGEGRVQMVGLVFQDLSYGVALPSDSPHREAINRALLRLAEDGTYQQLYARWFGESNAAAN